MPEKLFITNAGENNTLLAPSLSFILHHSVTRASLIFDLGIRKDTHNYPPRTQERIRSTFTVRIPQDACDSLEKGGLSPGEINHVCLSHCHWDHVGDPRPFTSAQFLVGAEAHSLFNPGWPADPNSTFPSDLLPRDRTTFLSSEKWSPIGPFSHAFDFYGDGSLYIIDSPGHLPGHINLLARTSSDGGWIYLAGDSAHHWNLITGESVMAGTLNEHGELMGCMHLDKEAAEETIRRIGVLWKMPRVRVIIAHDALWYEGNKGGSAFWPGKIDSL